MRNFSTPIVQMSIQALDDTRIIRNQPESIRAIPLSIKGQIQREIDRAPLKLRPSHVPQVPTPSHDVPNLPHDHQPSYSSTQLVSMPPRARPRHRPYTLATALGTASLILPACTLIRLANIPGHFPLYTSLYIGALSSITFLFYGYDKMQARSELWRVRESTLHTLAFVGGWPGALAGMHYFQHKTKKTEFQVVFWEG
jgi:uncharacterized membrane protein YsdA (DUF1294 family)